MNRILDPGNSYRQLHGLPALAGIASIPDAISRNALSVEAVVSRLKRFHYALKRLHRIFNDPITSEPIYELKMAFSLHAHLCAEHVAALGGRVAEMREPPLGLDKVPHPALEIAFDEIQAAPREERLAAAYGIAIPMLIEAMERHRAETNPLADHPTCRVLRFALLELGDLRDYGAAALPCLTDAEKRAAMADWLAHVRALVAAAGGLDGSAGETPMPAEPRRFSAKPYAYDKTVRRDERFRDPYNMGVNAEGYLYDPAFDDASKVLMMFFKRLREIDVPEMMAGIIAETPGQPWEYYRDMARQLWDEARHAMMGEAGFVSLGIDWAEIPVNFTWSQGLNAQLAPIERHAVLYFIEQGLMPKTGKRYEWEVGVASQNPLAALFQDYDWADEVLHAHIGRRWYVSRCESPAAAVDFGDRCWSKVMLDWRQWKADGLTEHRNWWPDLYRAACQNAGVDPDPAALAYRESYESKRADLKTLPPTE